MSRTHRLCALLHWPRPAETTAPSSAGVLGVCGELDYLTVGQLLARIEALAAGRRVLTVDLTGAWLYDRTALDALAKARDRVRHTGCELVFTQPPEARLARTATATAGRTRRRPRRARTGQARTPSPTVA